MLNTSFQERKIERLIRKRGMEFTFTRFKRNEFGELTNEIEKTISFVGVFHISNKANIGSYVQVFNEDATRREAIKQYMILTTYSRFLDNEVQLDDIVQIGNQKYKVMAYYNLESLNYGIEISLEDMQ